MVLKSIVILSLYIFPIAILLTFKVDIWMAMGLTFLIGIAKAGIGMSVMHDAVHGSYSSKKWVNKMMGASMYIIGSNVFNWKIQHNIFHHAYTNIDGHDEDIQSRWILRFSEHTPLKGIHRFQYIYAYFLYCLMTISMLFGDITQLIMYHKNGLLKKHRANPIYEFTLMLLVKLIYLFVVIALPI
jgi:linoleoyl-CoA desaturase